MSDKTTPRTMEHEARRFSQIHTLEQQLAARARGVDEARAEVKERQKDYDAVLASLLQAARDEGTLPLFLDHPGDTLT